MGVEGEETNIGLKPPCVGGPRDRVPCILLSLTVERMGVYHIRMEVNNSPQLSL